MIDREKVIREIEDALSDDISKAGYIYGLSLVGLKNKALTDVLSLLKEQPEIVRCKDCKYYRAIPGYCAYDRIWQENKGHVWGMYCKPDWFCADGKRKG